MAKASKAPGRPPGAANKANEHPRTVSLQTRISEGCHQVLEGLVKAGGPYQSKTDVIHAAVKLLALRSRIPKEYRHFIDKI